MYIFLQIASNVAWFNCFILQDAYNTYYRSFWQSWPSCHKIV